MVQDARSDDSAADDDDARGPGHRASGRQGRAITGADVGGAGEVGGAPRRLALAEADADAERLEVLFEGLPAELDPVGGREGPDLGLPLGPDEEADAVRFWGCSKAASRIRAASLASLSTAARPRLVRG
jgi:hypothetical protein